jgi:hypothetical protein
MAALFTSEIKVSDSRGFVYNCKVEHHPDIGTSIAYYNDHRISQMEYGIFRPPLSDDDAEWEEYQERFFEGIGGEKNQQLEYQCTEYFNNLNS